MVDPYDESEEIETERRVTYVEERVVPNPAARQVTRVVWIVATLIYALLGFRFILKLVGANPANPFAALVYGATAPLVYPFQNLVANPAVGNIVIEITTLIAILVYVFLTWLAIQLLMLLFRP